MIKILIIGVGGFLGSISRYAVYQLFDRQILAYFPYATLTVNVIGSLFIGLIYAWAQKEGWMTEQFRYFAAIGFCGSFTTFSTFAIENMTYMKASHWGVVALYISGSVILSVLAAFAGYHLAK